MKKKVSRIDWNRGMKSPCWHCHNRKSLCHDSCEKYKAFVDEWHKIQAWTKKEMLALGYACKDTYKVFK